MINTVGHSVVAYDVELKKSKRNNKPIDIAVYYKDSNGSSSSELSLSARNIYDNEGICLFLDYIFDRNQKSTNMSLINKMTSSFAEFTLNVKAKMRR